MIIGWELATCSLTPTIKLWLSLPDPLESLIVQIPPVDDVSLYSSQAEAVVTLLEAVRKKLFSSPRICQVNQSVGIAPPFAQDINLLKPSLTREFNQYIAFISFPLTVAVLIVSTLIHLVIMCIYHRLNLAIPILPKKSPGKKYGITPVLQVRNECPAELSTKRYLLIFLKLKLHLKCYLGYLFDFHL